MRDISIEIEKYQKDELMIGHLLYLDSNADPIPESPASRSSCPAMDARFLALMPEDERADDCGR